MCSEALPSRVYRTWAWVFIASALALLSACASPKLIAPGGADPPYWQGRIALKVPEDPAQSFSGDFELLGQAERGELNLYSPLGTTVARLVWSPESAVLLQGGQESRYASLEQLVRAGTRVDLPLAPMFDWLAGRPTSTAGWTVDLSAHAQGRVTAKREFPAPLLELRILLSR